MVSIKNSIKVLIFSDGKLPHSQPTQTPLIEHPFFKMKPGCPFPRGSGDLIHRKCSKLTGNVGQKVEKYVYLNNIYFKFLV